MRGVIGHETYLWEVSAQNVKRGKKERYKCTVVGWKIGNSMTVLKYNIIFIKD